MLAKVFSIRIAKYHCAHFLWDQHAKYKGESKLLKMILPIFSLISYYTLLELLSCVLLDFPRIWDIDLSHVMANRKCMGRHDMCTWFRPFWRAKNFINWIFVSINLIAKSFIFWSMFRKLLTKDDRARKHIVCNWVLVAYADVYKIGGIFPHTYFRHTFKAFTNIHE